MSGGVGVDVVPACDWMFFRSDLRASENLDIAKVVDVEYCQALVASRNWFSGRSAVTEDEVASFLYVQARGLDPGLQIGRLRGVQAGAFLAGWHIRLKIKTVLGQLGGEEFVPTASRELGARLMALRSPLLGALASALMTPGLSFDDVSGLRQRNLVMVDDNVAFTINDRVLLPPEEGRIFLATYYAWRRELLDDADAPLWVGYRGVGLRRGWFRSQLGKLTMLTGESFNAFNRRRIPENWTQRRGIAIARIAHD